jgi:hypothetical protein
MKYVLYIYLLCGLFCNGMQNQGTQTLGDDFRDPDLELGVLRADIPRVVSQDLGLTREDVDALRAEAERRWTRKRALTALTLMGTGASIATMLFVKFYDV